MLFAAWIVLLCLLVSQAVTGQNRATYDSIHTVTSGMRPVEILRFGDRLTTEGKTDEAIAAFSEVSNMFDRRMSHDDKEMCVRAHINLSLLWIEKGNLINALEVLMNALEISEDIKNSELTMGILNNMGYIYLTFEHYEEAAEYFSRAEELNRGLGAPDTDFLIFNNLAGTYASLGNGALAKEYLGKLRSLKVNDASIRESAPYYISLLEGVIQNNDGQFARGAESIRKAIAYASAHDMGEQLQCSAYEELYKSYRGMNDRDATLQALMKYYDSARKAPMPEKEVAALREIYRIHEQNGDTALAMTFKTRYLTLADSVMKFREFARLNSVRIVHETSRYKSEIAALATDAAAKKERIRRQFTAILIISAVALIIIALLVVVYRQKRKLHRSYEHLFRIHTAAMKAQKEEKAAHTAETAARKEIKYADSNLREEASAKLADAIRNIMENTEEPCSPDFSVQKLAELTGSNSKYVSQVINDSFGMNFSTMLNNCRINKAKERLADVKNYGNQTIQSISMGVGYKNQTSFITAFKKSVGMTPSIFLKLARQQADEAKS